MNISARFTPVMGACALLAGCGSPPPTPAPNSVLHASAPRASSYHILYSFQGEPGGARPEAGLVNFNGTLYGTTWRGGTYDYGTVFKITKTGKEGVLHSFAGGSDGAEPAASLIAVHGSLYGTTYYGGTNNEGTVFRMGTGGDEQVLHSFGRGDDAASPRAGLINVNGIFYGTTEVGGSPNWGTVYSIGPSQDAEAERVAHSFDGSDGGLPESSLINIKGKLYGTTAFGGEYGSAGGGDGTVFSVTTSGVQNLLHNFGSGSDGIEPTGNLIDVKGTLYGTTLSGGEYDTNGGGGTVFSITARGTERVLHAFGNGADGMYPWAPLLNVDGRLYGTTYEGGTYKQGIVFAIDTAGNESVLHEFTGPPDGAASMAPLINVDGKLYGTTYEGGKYGYGSVFMLVTNDRGHAL